MNTSPSVIWEFVGKQPSSTLPKWVNELRHENIDDLIREERAKVETKEIDSTYIDFLKQQIDLAPRGPEWTTILKKRLESLQPFTGKAVSAVTVINGNQTAFIKIDPEGEKIISIEEV